MTYRRTWTRDHGEDGLRLKFTVIHNSTGETITGTEELVIVLRPESDKAAYLALRLYAMVVWRRAPKLSDELRERLAAIAKRNEPPRDVTLSAR